MCDNSLTPNHHQSKHNTEHFTSPQQVASHRNLFPVLIEVSCEKTLIHATASKELEGAGETVELTQDKRLYVNKWVKLRASWLASEIRCRQIR
jgi:hypothetical protein